MPRKPVLSPISQLDLLHAPESNPEFPIAVRTYIGVRHSPAERESLPDSLRITKVFALEETVNLAQMHFPPKAVFNLTTGIFKSDILTSEEEYDDLNNANDAGNREKKGLLRG